MATKTSKKNDASMNVRIPRSLMRKIHDEASREGLKVSAVVRRTLIKHYDDRQEPIAVGQ